MLKMADVTIPVFDGEDYASWKKRIKMFCKMKKCDITLERAKLTSDREDWDEKDVQAVNYIYSAISNKQLEFVSDKETAYAIIQKFDELYLRESTALQIVCRNKLEKLKLKDYSDAATFFNDFEKNVNELKSAGANVTEKEKLNYMLNTLPDTYSYIGDLIDAMKPEDQTVEYVKNKIKMSELKNKGESTKVKSNAFVTECKSSIGRQGQTCYKCGKAGHFIKDCWSTSGGESWNRGQNQARNRGGAYQQNRGRGSGRRGSQHSNSGDGGGRRNGQRDGNLQSRGASSFCTTVECNSMNLELNRNNERSQINWLLDSGCTDHIINDDKYFSQCIQLKEPVNVKVGDGRVLKATKVGNVVSYFQVYDKKEEINIVNVFFVKEMESNLISFAKITDNNKIVSEKNTSKIYNKDNILIAIAWKEGSLYKMKSKLIYFGKCSNVTNSNNVKQTMTLKEKWHRTLGHVNFKYLSILCKDQILDGIPKEIESEYMKCRVCIENKMHNVPFENNRYRAREILEIVHTDLNGPHTTEGLNGEKYFLTFVDDYSKLVKVYTIKSKAQVYDCFVEYINEVENLTGKSIKKLRCDNGKEYINKNVYGFVREKGIQINACPPYVHELNGTAERYNRIIMDLSRCLLDEARVHRRFWPEIVCTAAYLKNRTLANTFNRKTPYEIFFEKKPSVKHLRLYGSKIFVRVPEQKRDSKWDKKAKLGVLLGYTEVGYRVLLDNKIVVARHVDIVEEDVNCIGFREDNDGNESETKQTNSEKNSEASSDSEYEDIQEIIEEDEQGNNNEKQNDLRRSERIRKPPARFDDKDFVYNNYIYVNYCSADTPDNFEEAMNVTEFVFWKEAMDREIECLNKNKTWKLVQQPENKKVLDVKWVFTKKSIKKFKARLVVRGFQQKEIVDDIYSPVAKMQTLKILLSYCCQEGLIIEQMDVETAFLNGKVFSEIYIRQPRGYEDGTNRVCKLFKALYGLRESPRAWYDCFDNFVSSLGFKRSKYDYCLYVLINGEDVVYLILFVDDVLICCKSKRKIDIIKSKLSKRFQMKDMGKVDSYLGINIDYNINENEMTLSQKSYIESLAKKYKIENSKLYSTPMETNLRLEQAKVVRNDIGYRNLIGALLYISSATRPDISFSVNYLSRFQNCYDETHYKYALRILKYLYLTKDFKLIFNKNEKIDILDCYVDADWAGDIVDRKSTSGYVIRLFGNVIFWKSRKQNSVTKASTFAEYVALSEAVSEIRIIREILETFNLKFEKPIRVYEDNSGALSIAKYGNFTKNSKYIETHYHFVNDSYKKGIIDVIKVSSEENMADICTKSLCKEKFEKFRNMLNVI